MSRRDFWLGLIVIEAFLLVLHGNGLRVLHAEGDEIVLAFLAMRLAESPTAYHLRGELSGPAGRRFHRHVLPEDDAGPLRDRERADLLYHEPDDTGHVEPRYDPQLYGQALFFHPPLYPYALAVTHRLIGIERGVLLSSLCHAIAVLLLALLGRRWAGPSVGLVAAGLLAVEAVSWIGAERLWIEAMLQAAVVGAMLLAAWSVERGGRWPFVVAGLALGFAGLTKLPAGVAAPAVLVLWLVAARRPRPSEWLAYVCAAALPVLAWMIVCLVQLGTPLPMGRPTEWMIEQSPFLANMLRRSPIYYIVAPILASPFLLYALVPLRDLRRERWLLVPATWVAATLVAMSIVGVLGMGFQLRYLGPGLPAACLLAAAGLWRLPSWARIPALPFGAYALHVGITTALTVGAVEPPTPHTIFRFVWEVFDYRILSWFEGMY